MSENFSNLLNALLVDVGEQLPGLNKSQLVATKNSCAPRLAEIAKVLAASVAAASEEVASASVSVINGNGLQSNCLGVICVTPGAGSDTTLGSPVLRKLMTFSVPFSFQASVFGDGHEPAWAEICLSINEGVFSHKIIPELQNCRDQLLFAASSGDVRPFAVPDGSSDAIASMSFFDDFDAICRAFGSGLSGGFSIVVKVNENTSLPNLQVFVDVLVGVVAKVSQELFRD